MSKLNYKHTIFACFSGYIVQAIINNFVPLLFLTFNKDYGISLTKITFLVTFNFGLQLVVDLISVKLVDKIGYRLSTVIAHVFGAAGLVALTILPRIMPDAFMGLLISVSIYAVGGGMIEVLISPIMEFCPTDNKEKAMSLLHSFYCWGHVLVVVVSVVFFQIFGIENWTILALVWAIVPILNAILFAKVPITEPSEETKEKGSTIRLFKNKIFWTMLVLMVCAGASEQAVSQWASTFAEQGLGVSKAIGDLAGPMMFAIFMGLSRAFYGKYGHKININTFMIYSGILCVLSYLLIALSPNLVLGLVGCAITGLSVGIMWPGTFSISSGVLKGGTAMFGLLAVAGDVGCMAGPTIVGLASQKFGNDLRMGILFSGIFPAILVFLVFILKRIVKNKLAKS